MKHRVFAYIVLIFLPLVTIIRTWQLSTAMDAAGFYLEPYTSLCESLGYALLGLILVLLLTGRFFLQSDDTEQLPTESIPLGLAAAVTAVCCVPQALTDIAAATTENAQVLAIVPNALLGTCFGVIAVCLFQGKTVPFWATALPVITEFIRLISAYAHFNGIAQISENVIHILFMCSFLAFCLSHCRVLAKINSEKAVGWAYGTGAATVLLGFLSSVPHWIVGQNQHTLSTLGFGAAVYALIFLFTAEWGQSSFSHAKHLKPRNSR